jgi:hypothetical protein
MMRRQTRVGIVNDEFYINGRPTYAGITYRGAKIQGLLLNSRMVQGIFDDLNPETCELWKYPDTGVWDAARNTREFIEAMPVWRDYGLLSIVVGMQGGNPQGYRGDQPWRNSAFTATGELVPEYLERLQSILDEADSLGMVVQLNVFYFGQDEYFVDESAILRALENTCLWVLQKGYENVILDVVNETDVPRYEHEILTPTRVHELIQRAKEVQYGGKRLLAGTSFKGGAIPTGPVVSVSDFILIHGNGVEDPRQITEMVNTVRRMPEYRSMPILFNEDDHFDFEKGENNMVSAINAYASWGFLECGDNNYRDGYQSPPVNWGVNTPLKKAFFEKVKEVTGGLMD